MFGPASNQRGPRRLFQRNYLMSIGVCEVLEIERVRNAVLKIVLYVSSECLSLEGGPIALTVGLRLVSTLPFPQE